MSINKKALSPIIAYVILVTIVISTSLIVYPWLKTYVQPSSFSCPDGVSIYLNQIDCTSVDGKYELNLSIKNNGFFSVAGYFINFRDEEGKFIPWSEESIKFMESTTEVMGGSITQRNMKPGVNFIDANSVTGEQSSFNPFKPDAIIDSSFIVNKKITAIELTPFRREGDKGVVVSCSDYTRELVSCN